MAASEALEADAVMLTRRHRTVVWHCRTTPTHLDHALLCPQLIQRHQLAAVEPKVPQTAAVELFHTRVQQPRKLLGVRSSADEERRTQIQGAVVARCQLIKMLLAIHGERESSAGAFYLDVMWLTVVDSCSDEEPLGPVAEVEQGVEVAVADLDGEEVRLARSRTGHHHHAVTLDGPEVELDATASAGRPLR